MAGRSARLRRNAARASQDSSSGTGLASQPNSDTANPRSSDALVEHSGQLYDKLLREIAFENLERYRIGDYASSSITSPAGSVSRTTTSQAFPHETPNGSPHLHSYAKTPATSMNSPSDRSTQNWFKSSTPPTSNHTPILPYGHLYQTGWTREELLERYESRQNLLSTQRGKHHAVSPDIYHHADYGTTDGHGPTAVFENINPPLGFELGGRAVDLCAHDAPKAECRTCDRLQQYVDRQNRQIESRDEEIATLRGIIETKDYQMATLGDMIQVKDNETAVFEHNFRQKDVQVVILEQELRTKYEQVNILRKDVKSKDNLNRQLVNTIEDKDRQVSALKNGTSTRDELIDKFKQVFEEKDARVLMLETSTRLNCDKIALLEHDVYLACVRLGIYSRNHQDQEDMIHALHKKVKSKDDMINVLELNLQNKEEKIDTLEREAEDMKVEIKMLKRKANSFQMLTKKLDDRLITMQNEKQTADDEEKVAHEYEDSIFKILTPNKEDFIKNAENALPYGTATMGHSQSEESKDQDIPANDLEQQRPTVSCARDQDSGYNSQSDDFATHQSDAEDYAKKAALKAWRQLLTPEEKQELLSKPLNESLRRCRLAGFHCETPDTECTVISGGDILKEGPPIENESIHGSKLENDQTFVNDTGSQNCNENYKYDEESIEFKSTETAERAQYMAYEKTLTQEEKNALLSMSMNEIYTRCRLAGFQCKMPTVETKIINSIARDFVRQPEARRKLVQYQPYSANGTLAASVTGAKEDTFRAILEAPQPQRQQVDAYDTAAMSLIIAELFTAQGLDPGIDYVRDCPGQLMEKGLLPWRPRTPNPIDSVICQFYRQQCSERPIQQIQSAGPVEPSTCAFLNGIFARHRAEGNKV